MMSRPPLCGLDGRELQVLLAICCSTAPLMPPSLPSSKRWETHTENTQCGWVTGHTADQLWFWHIWMRNKWPHLHVFMGGHNHVQMHIFIHTVSSSWQNVAVTLKMGSNKATSVCLTIQHMRQKGKYRGSLLAAKGWVNHELSLPGEHHHLFMKCQTQWVKPESADVLQSKYFSHCSWPNVCFCHWGVPVISFTSDLPFFLWSGLLTDESWRGYNWCPAGEVTPKHSLLSLPVCPVRRVSEWTTDQAGSYSYVDPLEHVCNSLAILYLLTWDSCI